MESSYSCIGYVLSLLNINAVNWILRRVALLSADVRQGQVTILEKSHNIRKIETKFIKLPSDSDPLQHFVGSSLAYALPPCFRKISSIGFVQF